MVLPFNTTHENGGDEASARRNMQRPTAPPLITIEGEFTDPDMYVDFLILGNKENYSIRGEKKPILDSNTQLAHIISGAVSSATVVDGKFVIRDVDKDNFEIFIRYLETKFIKFHTPTHMLQMLEIASRFQCRQLEIHCVKELDLNLTTEYVIEVFRALWYYNSITPPKRPEKEVKGRLNKKQKDKIDTPLTPEEYFAALLNNCLQLIDMNAEEVFAQDKMLSLRFEEMEMIVKRDALQMSSESVLFDLLARWSRVECQRKNLDVTSESRRRVLGALCFTPRFLTMTFKEFETAKDRVELLDAVETNLVANVLNGKKQTNLTPEQTTMITNFKKPRPEHPSLPIQLSARSNPKNYSKKMRKAAADAGKDDTGCCERFFLSCMTVFACIFD